MKSFEFNWKENTITRHKATVGADEIIGCDVWYQPVDEEGVIVDKEGEIVIEWNDGTEDTKLDSEQGREVIAECKIW